MSKGAIGFGAVLAAVGFAVGYATARFPAASRNRHNTAGSEYDALALTTLSSSHTFRRHLRSGGEVPTTPATQSPTGLGRFVISPAELSAGPRPRQN